MQYRLFSCYSISYLQLPICEADSQRKWLASLIVESKRKAAWRGTWKLFEEPIVVLTISRYISKTHIVRQRIALPHQIRNQWLVFPSNYTQSRWIKKLSDQNSLLIAEWTVDKSQTRASHLGFLNFHKHLPRLEKKFIETYVVRNLVDSPNKIIHLRRKF